MYFDTCYESVVQEEFVELSPLNDDNRDAVSKGIFTGKI
jgi:hypothetical protein